MRRRTRERDHEGEEGHSRTVGHGWSFFTSRWSLTLADSHWLTIMVTGSPKVTYSWLVTVSLAVSHSIPRPLRPRV